MACHWTSKQYYERVEAIEQKYEHFLLAYRHYVYRLTHQQRVSIRETRLMHRVNGLYSALEMLTSPVVNKARAKDKREVCVHYLQEAVNEPSLPPEFVEVVQFVLDDMKTDVVAPITKIQGLLEA